MQAAIAAHQAASANNAEAAATSERSYPSSYISHDSATYQHVRTLWTRFQAWIAREGASAHLVLASEPTPAEKLFAIQEELALGDPDFSLPEDLLASFACHDGQDCFASSTGVLGRWYLLDSQTMYTEWRDQREMMEMGLYAGKKYTDARKAQPKHARINTEWWFNPRWIPIACSRGANLGGDLICVDLDPLLHSHSGQVILYFTESAERFVLANSLGEWLDKCVGDCERGVYRFDGERKTYVAGKLPPGEGVSGGEEKEEEIKMAATSTSSASTSAASAASASTAAAPLPTAASATIGVEAFMFSSLESRDHFIRNQTEALVYLPDNDFGLLSTSGLGGDLGAFEMGGSY